MTRVPRSLAILGASGLALAFTADSAGSASAEQVPILSIFPVDTGTVVVGGDQYPSRATVRLGASLAYDDGAGYAGGGSVRADAAGHFLVGFALPASTSAGRLAITASATGAHPQTVPLGINAAGRAAPETPERVPLAAEIAAPSPGVLRGGTTDLSDTTAYPDQPIIPGPLPVPDGGVTVPAGADLQSYVDRHPAGTQFDLSVGTYTGPGVILPKAGDRFYGAGAGLTVLRGLGIHRPDGGADDIEIHNISITGYADSGRNGAIDSNLHESDAASGWTITNSEIYGNFLGASLGPDSLVENNTFHDNTCKGAAGGMDGTVWRYNQFLRNRLPAADDPIGDCGGVKVTVETNNHFVGNLISDSGHPAGLWLDASCHDNLFEDNISYNNDGAGFTDETGFRNTFRHNIAAGNGRDTPDGWRRTGIVFQSSGGNTATDNYSWSNGGWAITVYAEDRHDARGDGRNGGNVVRDNVIDKQPHVDIVNINSPQEISGNTVVTVADLEVPLLRAGPQT